MRRHSTPLAPLIDSPDDVLAKLTLRGEEYAFEVLVQRYGARLSRFIFQQIGRSDQVEDILQHVWLHLYLALPELQARTSLRSWLFLTARNLCIDELRKSSGEDVLLSTLEKDEDEETELYAFSLLDTRPSPEEIAERHELQCVIRQAIAALPPSCRDVVSLWYIERLSVDAIARQLALSPATVRNVIFRSKSLLRARLASYVEASLS